jgi:ribonuclease HI
MLPEAIIYTDGSSGGGGEGGWAALVATPYFGIEITGWAEGTTNNRMEMIAAIEGLKVLHEPHRVQLVSDSAYLVSTLLHKWYEKWFTQWNYHRPNLDLWHQLVALSSYHEIQPIKVKGHNGHEHNERVDKLAVLARKDKLEGATILYGSAI